MINPKEYSCIEQVMMGIMQQEMWMTNFIFSFISGMDKIVKLNENELS